MPVSEAETWLQEQCRVLKDRCIDKEEAESYLPEVIKEGQRRFYKEYYDIPDLAQDILDEEYE